MEDAAEVELNDEESDTSGPSAKEWWNFETKDAAVEWMNDKIQKRLSREKSKYDPIVNERDTLKAEVDRLRPLEDATKTDSQRWESERENLTKELDQLRQFQRKAERDNLVREIAEDKGLPTRFLARIQGEDAESITADIEDFLNVYNDGKPPKPASRKPVETEDKPARGYGGGGSKDETDDKEIVQNVVKLAREQRNHTYVR